ncbi:hypothetical protein Pelo_10310 [Pelomyxa schiedti]|nr:hypothetical protein Pelo_10310 [Pelomyxa schiedti]
MASSAAKPLGDDSKGTPASSSPSSASTASSASGDDDSCTLRLHRPPLERSTTLQFLELVRRREAALVSGPAVPAAAAAAAAALVGRGHNTSLAIVRRELADAADAAESTPDAIAAAAAGAAVGGELSSKSPFAGALRSAAKKRLRVNLEERLGVESMRVRMTVRKTRDDKGPTSPEDIQGAYFHALLCIMSKSWTMKMNEDPMTFIDSTFQAWLSRLASPLALSEEAILAFCDTLTLYTDAMKKDPDVLPEYCDTLNAFQPQYYPRALDLNTVQQVQTFFSTTIALQHKPKSPVMERLFAKFLFLCTRDPQTTKKALLLQKSFKVDSLVHMQAIQVANILSTPLLTRAHALQRKNNLMNNPFYSNSAFKGGPDYDSWISAETRSIEEILSRLPPPVVTKLPIQGGDPLGILVVSVVQAKGLPEKRANLPVQCTLELQHHTRHFTSILRASDHAFWEESFSFFMYPIQDSKTSGLTISIKDKEKDYGSLFFLPADLIELSKPRTGWFPLLQKKKLKKECPFQLQVVLQFHPFPWNSPLPRHFHYYTLCVSEILECDKQSTKGNSVGISAHARWILDEYALRYGIHLNLKSLIEVNYYIKEMEQCIAIHFLSPAVALLESICNPRNSLTLSEHKLLEDVLASGERLGKSWIMNYFVAFEENKPPGQLDALLKLTEMILAKSHPGTEPSDAVVSYLKETWMLQLENLVADEKSTSEEAVKELLQIIEIITKSLERDSQFFYSTFKKYRVDLAKIQTDLSGSFIESRYHLISQGKEPSVMSEKQLNLFIELYFKLTEFATFLLKLNPAWVPIQFINKFEPYVVSWLWMSAHKLHAWIDSAIQVDQWTPVTTEEFFSSSVVDLFSACNPSVTFVKNLKWGCCEAHGDANSQFISIMQTLTIVVCGAVGHYTNSLNEAGKSVIMSPLFAGFIANNITTASHQQSPEIAANSTSATLEAAKKVCVCLSDFEAVSWYLSEFAPSLESLLEERGLSTEPVSQLITDQLAVTRECTDIQTNMIAQLLEPAISWWTIRMLPVNCSKRARAVRKVFDKVHAKTHYVVSKVPVAHRKAAAAAAPPAIPLPTPTNLANASTPSSDGTLVADGSTVQVEEGLVEQSGQSLFEFYNIVLGFLNENSHTKSFQKCLRCLWLLQLKTVLQVIRDGFGKCPEAQKEEFLEQATDAIEAFGQFFEAGGQGISHKMVEAGSAQARDLIASLWCSMATSVGEQLGVTLGASKLTKLKQHLKKGH